MSDPLADEARKDLFRALVDVQDQGSSVEESRRRIAEQFRITLDEVLDIEREGIAKQWPPL